MIRLLFYVKGSPPRETGGPTEVAHNLVRELLVSGRVDVTLAVQTDCEEQEIRSSLGTDGNLTILRLPYNPTPRELRALRPVLRAVRRADVVHFNEFPFRHLPLVLATKIRGIPAVYSLHGLVSQEIQTFLGPEYPVTMEEGGGSIQVRMPRAAARAALGSYRSVAKTWSAVVAPSESLKRAATELEGFDPERISVIPHGVAARSLPAGPPPSHDRLPRILFVGKLETIKGPDLLLEALDRLKVEGVFVELDIVGAGSLEGPLRARAASLPPHRITFHGAKRGKDLDPLFTSADIVVIPSRQESLSLVALEAMAAGRPVLATRVGGIPEIIHEPRNGILVSPDADAISKGLRNLIEHPEKREEMGKSNVIDSTAHTWSSAASKYLRLYTRLTGAPDSG